MFYSIVGKIAYYFNEYTFVCAGNKFINKHSPDVRSFSRRNHDYLWYRVEVNKSRLRFVNERGREIHTRRLRIRTINKSLAIWQWKEESIWGT